MDQEKIGNFISKVRKEKNITQEQLADKLHITNRAISKWENGISSNTEVKGYWFAKFHGFLY